MVDGSENAVEDIIVACATLSNVVEASGTTFPINVTFTVTDMSASKLCIKKLVTVL